MPPCNNGITIPTLDTDPCNGENTSSKCVVHESALTLLELPENSTLETILNTYMIALASALVRIDDLETLTADLEARILILEA